MPEDISPDLLFAYLTGRATRAGAARVEAWMAASADNRQLVDALQELRPDPTEEEVAADVEHIWQRVHEVVTTVPPARRPLVVVPNILPRWAVRIAASVALVAAAGVAAYWVRSHPASISSPAIASREITTAERQMRRVSLPDGSLVLLAPATTLRYSPAFDGAERRVHLVGRAYFQVAHDRARPFIVRAHHVDTRVLGTEFVVGAYESDSAVQVVVESGRVAVGTAADIEPRAVLGQGDGANVRQDGRVTVVRNIDIAAALRWTEGTLEFTSAPLPDVLAEFRRWYGMSIDVPDPNLKRERITGAYHRERPEQALRLLAAALGARIVPAAGGIQLVR